MGQLGVRYARIDALRGFAALWVVLYHLWNRFYPGLSTQGHPLPDGPPADPLAAAAFFAFGFGYAGVPLFFVLSGFCIHLPQARRGADRVAVGRFAARRFWRLYPAYLASIALSALALAAPKLLLAAGGRSFDWWAEVRGRDALVSAAFLQPVWPAALGFNGVYWTLVYEVQFYALYPALLWAVRRAGLAPVGAALLTAEAYLAFHPPAVQCLFAARYFEWFLGVAAAEAVVRQPPRVPPAAAALLAAAGAAAGVGAVFLPAVFPLRDLLLAAAAAGLVLLVARGGPPASRVWRGLAAVGVYSYSLYLIHIPVIDLVWVGIDRLLVPRVSHPPAARWAALAAVPASLAAGYVLYRCFERPFIPPPGDPAARPPSADKAAP